MSKKILVAYDGSELSEKAIEEAKNQVALIPDTEVHIISVAEITGPATNITMTKNVTNEIIETTRHQLENIENEFKEKEIDVITKVFMSYKNDNPGKNICEYAETNEMDLIIVGSRGLGNVKGLFLGSVSNNIVQNASVPVLVIK